MEERYNLGIERIRSILTEETVAEPYRTYFRKVAKLLIDIDKVRETLLTGDRTKASIETLQEEQKLLYADIFPENYETSYANPAYAVDMLGEELGAFLSALYAELRGEISYVYRGREEYLVVENELFIEIYNRFEEEIPQLQSLKDIFYWYASDYCDVFAADRTRESLDPDADQFAYNLIMNSDLDDLRYLYSFGEFAGPNEVKTAEYLSKLPQETINQIAEIYTEGYRVGFGVAGKDISKKEVVEIRARLGFERVVRKAVENFEKMGMRPVIFMPSYSVITGGSYSRAGYCSCQVNPQYDFDHKDDLGLVLDKQFVERKLEVMRTVLEQNKEIAVKFGGPDVMLVFGEKPFSPVIKAQAVHLDEKQEKLKTTLTRKSSQMINEYIHGEERSFSVIAWPIPDIGEKYEEIFAEIIKINTLDAKVYEGIQQKLIDALDQADYVHIVGTNGNKTDLKIKVRQIEDPKTQTAFENCLADINIPVGEVFTTPVLEGTKGCLFVSKVYLDSFQYQDLEFHFEDGKTTTYTCSNYENEEENQKLIRDNILFKYDSLPIGEFAIGTNTTAYVAAKKYDIAQVLPILIAEKMGPHFALGDTCYTWSEEITMKNPNGKEMIAKENSITALRKEDLSKAYFQCHTDITIPYEELGEISVYTRDGEKILLLLDGRFVLNGTELLNEPLNELE